MKYKILYPLYKVLKETVLYLFTMLHLYLLYLQLKKIHFIKKKTVLRASVSHLHLRFRAIASYISCSRNKSQSTIATYLNE